MSNIKKEFKYQVVYLSVRNTDHIKNCCTLNEAQELKTKLENNKLCATVWGIKDLSTNKYIAE